MAEERLEALLRVESGLSRSFWAAVVGVLGTIFWTLFVAGPSPDAGSGVAQTGLIIGVLQFAFYIWYAISAGRAAKVLGDTGWKYVAWILVAPFLAMIPIPIVSTIIGVSPLSIKFLLGGQLQEAIRQEGLAGIHASV